MNKLKYLFISSQGYFLALYFLSTNKHKYALLITHSLLVCFFLLNWIIIEYINPEDKNYGSSPNLNNNHNHNLKSNAQDKKYHVSQFFLQKFKIKKDLGKYMSNYPIFMPFVVFLFAIFSVSYKNKSSPSSIDSVYITPLPCVKCSLGLVPVSQNNIFPNLNDYLSKNYEFPSTSNKLIHKKSRVDFLAIEADVKKIEARDSKTKNGAVQTWRSLKEKRKKSNRSINIRYFV